MDASWGGSACRARGSTDEVLGEGPVGAVGPHRRLPRVTVCVSIIPGITMPPVASTSTAPSGADRPVPTSAIRSSTTSTSPPVTTVCVWSVGQHGGCGTARVDGQPSPSLLSPTCPYGALLRVLRPPSCSTGRCQEHPAGIVPDVCWRRIRGTQTSGTIRDRAFDRGGAGGRVSRTSVRLARILERGGAHKLGDGPLDRLLVADFLRILAGPYTRRCCSPTSAPRWSRSRRRAATISTRGWFAVARPAFSTYYLGVNRNKRSVALDFKDADDLALAEESADSGRRRRRAFPAGRAAPVSAWTTSTSSPQPTPGWSTPRSAASAAVNRARGEARATTSSCRPWA